MGICPEVGKIKNLREKSKFWSKIAIFVKKKIGEKIEILVKE